jgi:capsular exopolysaccharide synthesis family protein
MDPNAIVFSIRARSNPAAEQFRTLRSRLYRLREKHPVHKLLITSVLPGEGKTFVAGNLAQAIVRQHERRALLIDADLRYSRLHLSLGAPSAPGLSDYLRGEADEFSIIQGSPQDNLFLIPGGKPVSNPAELLGDGRLKSLLDQLTPVFDWVILDSPPTLPVSDAAVLAGLCDGVLLVVQAGETDSDLAQRACQEFREKNLIGVVLNRAQRAGAYEVYSYYAGDGKDKR